MARMKSQLNVLNALANAQNSNMLSNVTEIEVTFAGATGNAIGNDGGTLDPYTLFSVTGTVVMDVIGVCDTLVASAGGGTIEVGTAINTAGIIALTTASAIGVAGEIWHDASPDSSIEGIAIITPKVVTQDVILTTKTADVTAGVIKFYCMWSPLSQDGNVTSG